MTQHLQFLLLGLGGGAVIAALAIGLLLTYRASGVVNFAHAAIGHVDRLHVLRICARPAT